MTDTNLIWGFLNRTYPDDHVFIYLYCVGHARSIRQPIDDMNKMCKLVFSPSFTDPTLNAMVLGFLNMKKEQYKKGEIKIKPIYKT